MQFKKTTLENGLRIITVPMAENPSVTVLVMAATGSEYETKDINGISHFLEHMVFKGTPRRPKPTDISRELDGLGAQFNAFTSQEMTGYYAKVAAPKLDAVIDLLSDLYINPLLDEGEMKKEKGVIIEEIRMYNDLPQRMVHDVLGELMYGDQPVGWNVLGTEANLHAFTREQVVAYREARYKTSSTIVTVAGSFDEGDVISKIQKAFAGVSSGPVSAKDPVREDQTEPRIKASFKETDQTHIAIGLKTFPIDDPRLSAMRVMSAILGGGMSSRLWEKMREELGICYYIGSSHNAYRDHGDLTISAGVDNSRVHEAVKGILNECVRLKSEPISEAELRKAKDLISGNILLGLETSDSRAEFCAFQEILEDRIDSPDEDIAKIEEVTVSNVQKLAQQIFMNGGLNMAIVGRFKDGEAFKGYFKL